MVKLKDRKTKKRTLKEIFVIIGVILLVTASISIFITVTVTTFEKVSKVWLGAFLLLGLIGFVMVFWGQRKSDTLVQRTPQPKEYCASCRGAKQQSNYEFRTFFT